jgi:AAA ATPase domain/RTX calcium-binding nonapeptide repeat (4 copies)
VVAVAGEAGIGKTTLVRRFVEEADAGLRVVWAGCDDLSVPEPLAPIRDIARQADGGLAAAVEGGQPREIGRALREELVRVAPSLCVVEDCHWADEATLDVLSYVARRIAGTPSVLLVTFRDDELGGDHRLRAVVGSIPPVDLVRVQLEPLSRMAVQGAPMLSITPARPRTPRVLFVAVVAVATMVVVPSLAHGATLQQEGRTPHRLLLQADPGETNLVSVEGSNSVVIRDDGAPITVAGVPTCMPLDTHAVSCSAVRHVELDLNDGPDVAVIATPREVEVEGGNGPDRYVALAGDWSSRVDFDGGIGMDVANYFFTTTGVRVSVDLSAGDGRPGDDDRIRRNVESVFGSTFDDVLAGGPDPEHLRGFDGDDQITGGPGEDVLSGGEGNDRMDARDDEPDAVDCGGQLLDRAAVDFDADASITGCAEVTF